MAIFMLEQYTIRSDKLNEFGGFIKKYLAWLDERRPTLYKEVKSHKMISQMFGGNFGKYMEIWEYESIADCKKCFSRRMQDKELMTDFFQIRKLLRAGNPHYRSLERRKLNYSNQLISVNQLIFCVKLFVGRQGRLAGLGVFLRVSRL
jgi:hypothetical protein